MGDGEKKHLKAPTVLPWRARARLAFFAFVAGLSALIGLLTAQPVFDRTELRVSYYANEATEAELFLSDSFGNLMAERPQTTPVAMGINNVAFPLSDSTAQASFLQRFDPCRCSSPLLIEKVWLVDSFYSEEVDLESAVVVGATLRAEGTSYRLVPDSSLDPQLVFYTDVASFSQAAAAWRFGLAAALSLVLMLLPWGVASLVLIRRQTRAEGPSGRRTRLRRNKNPGDAAVALFGLIFAFGVAQQIVGAAEVGVTVDEPLHVNHLRNYFATGTFSSAAYGPLIALFGHGVNVVLGVEVWGYPLESAQAYVNRHLVVGVLGVLGTFGVATTAGIVLKSWRWGVVAGALASSVPLWIGHSMFNMKDVPVATGYTLLTLGLVLLNTSSIRMAVRFPLAAAGVVVGATITMGTRPGMSPLLVGSVVVAVVMLFLAGDRNTRRAIGVFAVSVGAVAGIWFMLGGVQDLVSAVTRSASFPWDGTNLYAGERVGSTPSLGMLLVVLGASLPVLIIGLVAAGLVFGIWVLTRRSGTDIASFEMKAAIPIIGFQAVGALASVPILDPVIYDGGRQILFIFPSLTLFAVFGLYALTQVSGFPAKTLRASRSVILLAVSAGLIVVQFDQAKLFPYNYTYYNAVAQGSGISGQWQTDYWGASIRELAAPIASGDFSTCRSVGDMNLNRESLEPCGSLAPYVGEAAQNRVSTVPGRGFWAAASDRALAEFGPIDSESCSFHSQVTRVLRGEEVSMSRLYVCQDQ